MVYSSYKKTSKEPTLFFGSWWPCGLDWQWKKGYFICLKILKRKEKKRLIMQCSMKKYMYVCCTRLKSSKWDYGQLHMVDVDEHYNLKLWIIYWVTSNAMISILEPGAFNVIFICQLCDLLSFHWGKVSYLWHPCAQ